MEEGAVCGIPDDKKPYLNLMGKTVYHQEMENLETEWEVFPLRSE